jgi:uncharacterized protein (TIGR02001 family)
MKSKKLAQSFVITALAVSGAAFAQTKAPEPDYTLSFNVGAVTDYRYRGISQTAREPALQGGADLAFKSGWYVGTWASTIKWIKDSSFGTVHAKGPVEVDVYGGYKYSINDKVTLDVGGLEYWYATNTYKNITGENANTFELYAALSMDILTVKYSHSLTNLFGTPNSKNSGYLDINATFDLGNGFSLTPHIGAQHIQHFMTYTDYSLTLGKDLGNDLSVSLAAVGTSKHKFFTLPGSGTKDLGSSTLVAGIKKTF